MLPLRKLALLAALVAVVGSGGGLPAQGPMRQAAPITRAQSDLPADPAIRFGTLPNGMRYALRRNLSQPGQVALRLRIDAGSTVERDDQRGLAHFVEHMVYRGTRTMPGNMAVERLQNEGLEWAKDIGATTFADRTTYRLNLPRGAASLDTALAVLRAQVSEATFNPAALDAERPVIESEYRRNDVPMLNSENARLRLILPRLGARMPPIGDMNLIRTARRERLVEFYHAYYRPSRTILTIAGDVEIDRVEAQVRQHFAGWRPTGPAGPDAIGDAVGKRPAKALVEASDDPGSSLVMQWTFPLDRSVDSRAKRRRTLLRSLAVAVLSDRITRMSRAQGSPFEIIQVERKIEWGAAETLFMWTKYKDGQLDAALATFEQAPRQLLRYGITGRELQEQIAALRSPLQDRVVNAARWSPAGHADALIALLGAGDVPTVPEADLALFDEAVKGLTSAEIIRELAPVFRDRQPTMLISTPAPVPSEAVVLAKLAAASRQPVSPPVQRAVVQWPYTDFGKAGGVASRRVIPGIEATVVTFGNGTILAVKPINSRLGEIQVDVSAGAGQQGMAKDGLHPQLATMALRRGGLGKLTSEQLEQALEGRRVRTIAYVDNDRFRWHSETRPADLSLQMQLLAAHVTDPALPPEALQRLQEIFATQSRATSAPDSALYSLMRELVAADEKSASSGSNADAKMLGGAETAALLREAIGRGPVRVVMVGDVTVDQAIAATASTFGALPPRGPMPAPTSVPTPRWPFPGGGEVTQVRHSGDATKALAYVTWPGPSQVADPREYRRLGLLAQLLQLRVTDVIRVREGLSYAPGVTLTANDAGPSQLVASAETTPANTAAFHAAMERIVRDLQSAPVTAEELQRVRGPLIDTVRGQRARSDYWLEVLKHVGVGPDPVDDIDTQIADIQAMTPADVQALVRKYLRSEAAWRASVTPAAPAANPAGPAR